jgi:hypothetical protein
MNMKLYTHNGKRLDKTYSHDFVILSSHGDLLARSARNRRTYPSVEGSIAAKDLKWTAYQEITDVKGASIGGCDNKIRERLCLSEEDLNARRAIPINT